MPYVFIEDFRAGVDRRKSQVAGIPGSLWDGVNVHLTRGGEIEKRKALVSQYSVPGTFGMVVTSTNIYVFGSSANPGVPAGVTYQQLEHPGGYAMTDVASSDVIDGKPYVIAAYEDGRKLHFYDGVLILDWIAGVARVDMGFNYRMAAHLATVINGQDGFTATNHIGESIVTITRADKAAFTITATAENGGSIDDQTATVALVQAAATGVGGTPETIATGSFTITGGADGTISGDSGAEGGGTYYDQPNKITSVTVNGVNILGTPVDWQTSNENTAVAVAAQINAYTSSPNYTATVSGAVVTLKPPAGLGATVNGHVVAVGVSGVCTVGSINNMAGGVNAVAGTTSVAQISTVAIGGTFDPGDRFTITLNSKNYGAQGNPEDVGTVIRRFKSKLYSTVGSIAYFCEPSRPSKWNIQNNGAGFISGAGQGVGSEIFTAIGVFQGNGAFFSSDEVQVWSLDIDPANNVFLNNLPNTGTRSPNAVMPFGNLDLFYLSSDGVRSVRPRDTTGYPAMSDIGSPIDPLVIAQYQTASDDDVVKAVSVIEPVDKRLWMAFGTIIYVFSYFPAAKISAWSTYEAPERITQFGIQNRKLYCRGADTIYLYGGDDGLTYDSSVARVTLPFLTLGKPGTDKELTGFDAAVSGTWDVWMLTDPKDENRKVKLGTISNVTYSEKFGGAVGKTTHFAPQLICTTSGPAKIMNLCVHHTPLSEEE